MPFDIEFPSVFQDLVQALAEVRELSMENDLTQRLQDIEGFEDHTVSIETDDRGETTYVIRGNRGH